MLTVATLDEVDHYSLMLLLSTFDLFFGVSQMLPVSTPRGNLYIEMKKPKPYHHGNLQEVLLESTISLIAEVGPAGFTLREVARRAGVSHNAPYRHFRDKDALLANVAAQGYKELARSMTRASDPQAGALESLKQAGLAYVSFALRRPEHF